MFVRIRFARYWAVACLLCLGFWQLGQGAYIPAKAWLAQGLMQRAWVRTGMGHALSFSPKYLARRTAEPGIE